MSIFAGRFVRGCGALLLSCSLGLSVSHATTSSSSSSPDSGTPNILNAEFFVNGTGLAMNCTNMLQNGSIGVHGSTLIFNSQSGASFTAKEVLDTFFDNYVGTIKPSGDISGTSSGGITGVATDVGTFTGNVDIKAGTLTISEDGMRTFPNGDTCEFHLDRTGTLVSGPTRQANQADVVGEEVSNLTESFLSTTGTIINSEATAALSLGGRGDEANASTGLVPVAGGLRYQGYAAGDGFEAPWGVWGNVQYADFEDDFSASRSESDRYSVTAGIDFQPWDDWVFGVAFAYEDSDIDTKFNRGGLDIDGFTIAPYMASSIGDDLGVGFDMSFDVAVGFSFLDIDKQRRFGRANITGDTDSDRMFFSGNLNVGQQFGNMYLSGLAGLIVARDNIDGFTETDGTVNADQTIDLGQLRLGGDLAYTWDRFEPFVNALFEYNFESEEVIGVPNDDTGVRVGVGIRYYGDTLSGGFEYNTLLAKDNIDDDIYSLTIRADF